jgi:hypothetical protein
MLWHTSFSATQTIPTTQLLGDLHQRNNAIRRSDIIPINVIRVRRRPVCRPNRLIRLPPLDASSLTPYLSPSRHPSVQALEPSQSASQRAEPWADCRRATRPGLVVVWVYWLCIEVTTTAEHEISWSASSQPQSHYHSSSCWRLPTPVSSSVGHIARRVTCRRGYQGRVSRSQQLQRVIPTDADKKERLSNRLRGTDE